MEIEFNEDALWATMWVLLAAVIITLIVTIGIVNIVNVDHYTSRGYTRTTLPGEGYSQWVKANVDPVFTSDPQAMPLAAECSRLAKEAK